MREIREKKKKRVGAGGAWRAFVHHITMGKPFQSWKGLGLGQLYRSLSPVEKQYYIDMGKAASKTARMMRKRGLPSYGFALPKQRLQALKVRRMFQIRRDTTTGGLGQSGDQALMAEGVAMAEQHDPTIESITRKLEEEIKYVKWLKQEQNQEEQKKREDMENTLCQFSAEQGH